MNRKNKYQKKIATLRAKVAHLQDGVNESRVEYWRSMPWRGKSETCQYAKDGEKDSIEIIEAVIAAGVITRQEYLDFNKPT